MKIKIKKEYRELNELLKDRGIETDTLNTFISPTGAQLSDWRDLENCQKGIDLLLSVLEKNNRASILLPVDCDVDGFCAAAIAAIRIKGLFPLATITPLFHTQKQHGLEDLKSVEYMPSHDLILVTDASTNDGEICAEYPNTPFLVIDHHDKEESSFIPDNMILVNNQTSPNYKNKSLCGAGVTWQFFRGLYETLGEMALFKETHLRDLVALATVADMMDVTQMENRYFLHHGLNNIQNEFFKVLVEKQAFSLGNGDLSPIKVAFYIAPLINSMNRVGTMTEKSNMFDAFVYPDEKIVSNKRGAKGALERACIESARECTNTKSRQKKMQDSMSEYVTKKIQQDNLLDNKILFIELGSETGNIPSEINGLAANQIANKYKRPTLIGKLHEGEYKGSIRNIGTLDMPPLKDFLLESGKFNWVQGHGNAAGFSINKENLESFHQYANEELANLDMNTEVWDVDFSFDGEKKSEMTAILGDVIRDIDMMDCTWGQYNKTPLIHLKNLHITKNNITVIRKKTNTIKITLEDITLMIFRCDEKTIEDFTNSTNFKLEVVGSAMINNFMGACTNQIIVDDYNVTKIETISW